MDQKEHESKPIEHVPRAAKQFPDESESSLLFYIPPYPIHDGEVDLLGQARKDTSAITGPFIYSLGIT
jgi:hypothetical protein